jgi:hypothetical protein
MSLHLSILAQILIRQSRIKLKLVETFYNQSLVTLKGYREYKEYKGNKNPQKFKILNGLIQAMDLDVQLRHLMLLTKKQLLKCQNRR